MNSKPNNSTQDIGIDNKDCALESLGGPANQLTLEQKQSAKIFLIDDEPIILELFSVFLCDAGFKNVSAFTDSVEAIETLRYVTPSIILTDINMPEVSGNFLIKLIRTYDHLSTTPIVAITSNTTEEARESILRKGADAVIHKPVDSATLCSKVSQILESTLRMNSQISEAEEREQQKVDQKKAAVISLESSLRDMMR